MHKFKDLVLAFLSAQLGIISLLLFPKRVCRICDLLAWNRGASWAETVKFTFHRGGSVTLCRSWNGKILFSLLVVLWDGFKPLRTKQYNPHFMWVCVYVCVYMHIERASSIVCFVLQIPPTEMLCKRKMTFLAPGPMSENCMHEGNHTHMATWAPHISL